MIDKQGEFPITRQCELLGLNRSGVYYTPRPVPEADLRLMRRIDEIHLEFPTYGSRPISKQLVLEGHQVGRLHVRTLMRLMGLEALYRRPRTTIPARDGLIYPYLLGGVTFNGPNHVWSKDITYLPMESGFLYLTAILDIFSRKALSFRLSNTLTTDFCVEALEEALWRYGKPEIVNTDKGSQYTSEAWIDALKARDIRISMDGKGRWVDNVFIERLWRSVKYEEVYLRSYSDGREAHERLTIYFESYNGKRLHQSLDYHTPDDVYLGVHKPPACRQFG
jgi:putative transposase